MPHSRYLIGTLPFYSVLIVTGMALAIFLASREEKRLGLPKDTILDVALILLPVSIVFARIYYVVFNWGAFRDNPVSVFFIWEGGIAIYGGLIGGVLTLFLYEKKKGLPLFTLFDCIVPGVALAQSIGRWGNFFNMEAYGLPVTDPRLQFFPFAVQIPESGGLSWHLATFFYESVWDFGIFLLLFILQQRNRSRRRGDLFFLYSLFYAVGRLVVEELRTDSLMAGELRISQVLAFVITLAVLLLFLLRLQPKLRRIPLSVILMGFQTWLFLALPGERPALAPFFLALCLEMTLLLACHKPALMLLPLVPAWLLYGFWGRFTVFPLCVTFSVSALLFAAVLLLTGMPSDAGTAAASERKDGQQAHSATEMR